MICYKSSTSNAAPNTQRRSTAISKRRSSYDTAHPAPDAPSPAGPGPRSSMLGSRPALRLGELGGGVKH